MIGRISECFVYELVNDLIPNSSYNTLTDRFILVNRSDASLVNRPAKPKKVWKKMLFDFFFWD